MQRQQKDPRTARQRLASRRSLFNMTQAQVAKHLGISKGKYVLWETGVRNPDIEEAKALADLFQWGKLENDLGAELYDLFERGTPAIRGYKRA